MRNVKYYRWNNEMGERASAGKGEQDRKGANEAPLFDISYSTFSAVAAEKEEMN